MRDEVALVLESRAAISESIRIALIWIEFHLEIALPGPRRVAATVATVAVRPAPTGRRARLVDIATEDRGAFDDTVDA